MIDRNPGTLQDLLDQLDSLPVAAPAPQDQPIAAAPTKTTMAELAMAARETAQPDDVQLGAMGATARVSVMQAMRVIEARLHVGDVDAFDAAELAKLPMRVMEAVERVRLAEKDNYDNIPNITVMLGADFSQTITVEPVQESVTELTKDVTPRPTVADAYVRVSTERELEVERLLELHVTPISDVGSGDDE